jgi:hypothetical protein
MAERRNAIIAIAATLAVPLLFWLGAALAALSILRHGWREANSVVLIGSLPAIGWLSAGVYPPALTLIGAVLLATFLRQTVSMSYTMVLTAGIGLLLHAFLLTVYPEQVQLIQEQIKEVLDQLADASPEQQVLQAPLAPFIVGMLSSSYSLLLIICLLLARSWQAEVYNPGGFKEEFQQLMMPKAYSAIVILMLVADTTLPPAVAASVSILTLPMFIAGCALVHHQVNTQKLGGNWLFVFYLCVFLSGPVFYTLLIFIAALDGFFDIGKRFKDTADPQ